MTTKFQEKGKIFRIIKSVIEKLDLDLSGLNILTEIGSNEYLYLPIIAGLANANKIYGWTRTTGFGNASENIKKCQKLFSQLDIKVDLVALEDGFEGTHIEEANIITNSGHLRPLNKTFLSFVNQSRCVIPLMYEKWELRADDIDINYCREKAIKVAGTFENHPSIKVFDTVGHLAIKMSFEAGYEIYDNKILIWSGDEFGEVIYKAFKKLNPKTLILTTDPQILYSEIDRVDFIFFSDYNQQKSLFGDSGILDLEALTSKNKYFGIIHLYGDINNTFVKIKGIEIFPDQMGFPKKMSRTLSYIGSTPAINLFTAGLKVGELMFKNETSDLVQPITF